MSTIDPLRFSIAQKVSRVLPRLGVELSVAEVQTLLATPPDRLLGHFSFPCFRFAKSLRKPPTMIANDLQKHLNAEPEDLWQQQIEAKGGFVNFKIQTAYLAKVVVETMLDGRYFTQAQLDKCQTIMVEFSQPNTHKLFHVGHARNVCLGDSISRILRYCGHRVITANYIGDEGMHVAKCLWHVEHSQQSPPDNHRAEWLGEHYALANEKLHADDHQQQNELSEILRQLEGKQGPFYRLWQQTRDYCLADFNAIYRWLATTFDVYYYESQVSPQAKNIISEFIAKGVFHQSQGAYGINLDDLGFFMVLKSDGNTLYSTKDLALAYQKFQNYSLDRSIYIVGAEQSHYFKQVFKTLEAMGFGGSDKNVHLSYGLVKLQEGKMSSRSGNIVPFSVLQQDLQQQLLPFLEKYRQHWSEQQLTDTLQKLACGTIKYGMLQTDPNKEIVFDLPTWLRFDGNTGLYLMYAYARARSIITKAEHRPNTEHLDLLTEDIEDELLSLLYRFNGVIHLAHDSLKPSLIATHLYTMAKVFSKYYTEHSILRAQPNSLIEARLAVVCCFADCLRQGLLLLGIDPPEQM